MGNNSLSKKISLALLLIIFILTSNSYAALHAKKDSEPKSSSLNPEFIQYINSKKDNDEKRNLGHVPSPLKLDNKKAPVKGKQSFHFPSKFDLRDEDKLTEVKDQGENETCWTFATFGALESRLMPNEHSDFSEDNLAHHTGFDWDVQDGGNRIISTAYLARWSGPVLEEDDPYDDGESSGDLQVQKHVQEVLFLPNDIAEIKKALMKYGAVHTSVYAADEEQLDYYYNDENYSYYYDGNEDANHDIDIVGWDDDFSADNFATKPDGDGAFICRNSWGKDFGDNGYYYVSYYDNIIGTDSTVYSNIENSNNYDNIYQYDPLGSTGSLGFSDETAWFSNVFTKNSNTPQDLCAVSFYTLSPNSYYEVWINTDFEDTDDGFSNMQRVNSGRISTMGYHTINLNENVPMESDKFLVAIKLTSPNNDYPITIESQFENYSSNATANSGESYISPDGFNWKDITSSESDENSNVCFKAFTKNTSIDIDIDNCNEFKSKNNIPLDKSWKIKFNKAVNFDNLDNDSIKIYDAKTFKQIPLTIDYDDKNNTIEITPKENYKSQRDYYIYIGKNIESTNGNRLKRPVIMRFTTE